MHIYSFLNSISLMLLLLTCTANRNLIFYHNDICNIKIEQPFKHIQRRSLVHSSVGEKTLVYALFCSTQIIKIAHGLGARNFLTSCTHLAQKNLLILWCLRTYRHCDVSYSYMTCRPVQANQNVMLCCLLMSIRISRVFIYFYSSQLRHFDGKSLRF